MVVRQRAPEVIGQLTWRAGVQQLGHCDVMYLTPTNIHQITTINRKHSVRYKPPARTTFYSAVSNWYTNLKSLSSLSIVLTSDTIFAYF